MENLCTKRIKAKDKNNQSQQKYQLIVRIHVTILLIFVLFIWK